jgi:hypothetical protein
MSTNNFDNLSKNAYRQYLKTGVYTLDNNSEKYKGFFNTKTELESNYNEGLDGWYAVIGDTDSFYVWDSQTNKWKAAYIPISGVSTGLTTQQIIDIGNSKPITNLNYNPVNGVKLDKYSGTYYNTYNQVSALVISGSNDTIIGGKASLIIRANGSEITFSGMIQDVLSSDIDNTSGNYNLIEFIKHGNGIIYYLIKNLSL